MSMEETEERAEARVQDAIHWMESHEEDSCLMEVEHHATEYTPHIRLVAYEEAAVRHGLHLYYAGCEAQTTEVDEPFYFVLVSRKESLTTSEVKRLVPGLLPVQSEDSEELRAAA